MPTLLRVLILEDNRYDAELMLDELRAAGFTLDYQVVSAEADYLERLETRPDIILADYHLPQFDGPTALRQLQERGFDIPFIIISGTVGEEQAAAVVKAGATDYLLKDRLTRLSHAVTQALEAKSLREAQRQAEAALRASEVRFRALIEKASDAVLTINRDGLVLYESPSIERVTGFLVGQRPGRNVLERIHPDDLDQARHAIERVIQQPGSAFNVQLRARHADGSWRWIEVTLTNLLDEPHVEAIVINFRDINERKQAEIALRRSEEKFSRLFATSPDIIAISSVEEGRYIEVNEGFTQVFGYTREELVGHTILELNIWPYMDERLALITTLREQGFVRDLETHLRCKSGDIRVVLISAQAFDLDGTRCILSVSKDITERKAMEDQLRSSEEKFSKAFAASPDHMAISTLEKGRYLAVNERFIQETGFTREETIGHSVAELNIQTDLARRGQMVATLKEQGFVRDFELQARRKSGEVRTMQMSADMIVLNGEECLISVSRDITERKAMEDRLRDSEARQKAILSAIPDLIFRLRSDGTYVDYRGPAAATLVSPEFFLGKTLTETMPESVALPSMEAIRQVIVSRQPVLFEYELLQHSYEARFVALDETDDVLGIVRDISERKQAEMALRSSEEKFSKAFTASPDAVMISSLETERCLEVNNGYSEIFGYSREETLGRDAKALNLWVDLEQRAQLMRELEQQGRLRNAEVQFRRQSGDTGTGLLSGENIELNGERCVLTVFRDITERKQAERVLQRYADRMAALNQLDRIIASNLEIDEIYATFVTALQTLVPLDRTAILRLNAAGDQWHVVRQWSRYETAFQVGEWRPLKGSQLEWVVTHRAPFVEDEIGARLTESEADRLRYEGLRSRVLLPLLREGRVIGVLTVGSRQAAAYSSEDQTFLITLADQLTVAIQNADLYAQARRHAQELEQHVDERTAELAKVNNRLEAIFNHSGDGIVLVDVGRGIQQANTAFERLFEVTPQRYLDRRLRSFFLPAEMSKVGAMIDGVIATRQKGQVEAQVMRADGVLLDLEISLAPVDPSNQIIVSLVVIIRDVSERKEAEVAMAEERNLLRTVIDAVPDHIYVKDTDHRIVLSNAAHARTAGQNDPAVLIGMTDADLFPIEMVAKYWGDEESVFRSGQPILNMEERAMGPDRQEIWALTSLVPFQNLNGDLVGLVRVTRDITTRKQAEQALEQALEAEKEMNQLKSRFVSMASHEFRTPMATVLSATELLQRYRTKMDEERIDQKLNTIVQQVKYLTNMINDVLDLSRIQSGKTEYNPVSADLDGLCREVLEEFRSRIDVAHELRYACVRSPLEVIMDKRLMREVINNLVSNAVKYSPSDQPVEVEISTGDETVVMRVRDHGIGIPVADMKHLFEPFHRASNVGVVSGTGLGLTITREAVELHGGTIVCESDEGSGTTFVVTLPQPWASDQRDASRSETLQLDATPDLPIKSPDEPAESALLSVAAAVRPVQPDAEALVRQQSSSSIR